MEDHEIIIARLEVAIELAEKDLHSKGHDKIMAYIVEILRKIRYGNTGSN